MRLIDRSRLRAGVARLTAGSFGGKNFVSIGGGQVMLGVAQWGSLSILALLGGAAAVGELAFALAVVTPTFQLVKMKLRDVLATDVAHRWSVADYLAVTGWACLAGTAISLAVASLLSGTALLIVVLGVAGSRWFEALSQISYGYEQREDHMVRIGWSLAIRGVLSLVLLLVSYWWTRNVDAAALSLAAANGLVYLFYDREPRQGADDHRTVSGLTSPGRRALIRLALPLGFISALSAITDSVPRLVVESSFGLIELGILSAFGYVIVGASYVTRAVGQASGSRVASVMASQDKELLLRQLWRLLTISFVTGGAVIVGAYVIGEPFLDLVFGPEFAAFASEFGLITFYALVQFVVTPLTIVLIAARRFRIQLGIEVLSTAAAIYFSFALIPEDGIRGAVFALIISGAVRAVLSAAECYRVIRRL